MRHFPYPITIRILNGWIEVGAPDFSIIKAKKRFDDLSTATELGKLVIEVMDEACTKIASLNHHRDPVPAPSRPKGVFDAEVNLSSDLLTTSEVQRILGVSHETVRRLCNTGKLIPARTTGGHRRFRLSEVQIFLEKLKKNSKKAEALSATLRGEKASATLVQCHKPSGAPSEFSSE